MQMVDAFRIQMTYVVLGVHRVDDANFVQLVSHVRLNDPFVGWKVASLLAVQPCLDKVFVTSACMNSTATARVFHTYAIC